MIGLPAQANQQLAAADVAEPVNPFAEIITPDVVKQILTKQVERAQAGDSRAAALVLKIALASSGKNQAPRRNPESPLQKPPTVAQVAAQLRLSGLTVYQLAARLSCDADDVREILQGSNRFCVNSRGQWSLAQSGGE